MADECKCPCLCDGPTGRVLDQSMGRYNDRSAFANNNAQDQQVQLLGMFNAQAQNSLEQTPTTDLMSMMTQLIALSQARTPGT